MKSGIKGGECLHYSSPVFGDPEMGAGQAPPYAMEGLPQIAEPFSAARKHACIALIDGRPLTRASLARLLGGDGRASRRSGDLMVWTMASSDEFLGIYPPDADDVGLIVHNLGTSCALDERAQAERARLRQAVPGIPLILLSDCVNPAHIVAALREGIRGYLPSSLEPAMAIQVVRLVLAGGTFIPPGAMAAAGAGEWAEPEGAAETDPGARRHPAELTPRQGEVFELLRKGKSNKLIAYELGMQESTVKVHVRQIMRKLKAINRTHAVFLADALANGASEVN